MTALLLHYLFTFSHCRSQQRCVDVEKPKKKKTLSSTSLVSIPNSIAVIKLSMLNSGLLSFGEFHSTIHTFFDDDNISPSGGDDQSCC
jgi:hypothetical protein